MKKTDALDRLAELIAGSSLEVKFTPDRLARPAHLDLLYNICTASLVCLSFGRPIVRDDRNWMVVNYTVAKFAQFICRRRSVLADFRAWHGNRLAVTDRHALLWPALPRGFMTHDTFDMTVNYLVILREALRSKKNLLLSWGPTDFAPKILTHMARTNTFALERATLAELAGMKLTQKMLGVV